MYSSEQLHHIEDIEVPDGARAALHATAHDHPTKSICGSVVDRSPAQTTDRTKLGIFIFGVSLAKCWIRAVRATINKLKETKSRCDGVANVDFLLEGTGDVQLVARLARFGSAAVEDVGGVLKERCSDTRSKFYYDNINDVCVGSGITRLRGAAHRLQASDLLSKLCVGDDQLTPLKIL